MNRYQLQLKKNKIFIDSLEGSNTHFDIFAFSEVNFPSTDIDELSNLDLL